MGIWSRFKARRLHEKARALEDPDAALQAYQEVLALDPDRPTTLYNIGLIHKYRGEWVASLAANRRAAELDPRDEATGWNLAIAATALREWGTARQAWQRLGLPVPAGEGTIDADFGMAPVRLNPDGEGEVVWGRRIDPVRVRIESIPFPESGHRYGDVMLHDGAPVGTRKVGNREFSVFNALQLFESSALTTFAAEVEVTSQDDLDTLTASLMKAGIPHEDWTKSVRFLCRSCSQGRAHENHDSHGPPAWANRHSLGMAAEEESHVRTILDDWANPDRRVLALEARLPPPVSTERPERGES